MIISTLFNNNNDSKIIFYHDIHSSKVYCDESSTPLQLFKNHIQLIEKSSYDLVSNISRPKNQIKIQLDDGFKGIYDCLPFIVENKIPLEIFLIMDKINADNYLSEKQIMEMNSYAFISFSSHTVSHSCLNELNEKELRHELEYSKTYLQKILNQDVSSICYPKGLFNQAVVREANRLTYAYQYCSIPGSFFSPIFTNVYCRNLVQSSSLSEFSLVLKGGLSIFKFWFKNKHYKK